MKRALDVLIVNSPSRIGVYQSLATSLAALEPPIWAAMIAESLRRDQLDVVILDAEALALTTDQTAAEIVKLNARLVVFAVYGQQPSASSQCMPAASATHRRLKELDPELLTLFLGTHPSALPARTLLEERANYVCQGEGVPAISQLVTLLKQNRAAPISGIWQMLDGIPVCEKKYERPKDLDQLLPGVAWDLLPMERYRAHNWHCWGQAHGRSHYAVLYTGLGCPYKCSFCCINSTFGSHGIRYLSNEWVFRQLDVLISRYQVKNLKIADEMFVLDPQRVRQICQYILDKGYKLNLWCYGRAETINGPLLELMKRAGFSWIGIGIESASLDVRQASARGARTNQQISDSVRLAQDCGLAVGANYIVGLPEDSWASLEQTLNLAIALKTDWANFYSAMAYPGSPLYDTAKKHGYELPEHSVGWIGYSQHSFESLPLGNSNLSPSEVLTFRDYAFNCYFTQPNYLKMMQEKYGSTVRADIVKMTDHKLRRKLVAEIPNWLTQVRSNIVLDT